MKEYEYDVALSFAGEDRHYAEALAELLKNSRYKVFYDKYELARLWGKNLYTHLSSVYKDKAHYCVMFLSEHYARKLWTNHERESAQARAFAENEEYILPVRIDDTEIPGILPTVGYLDLRLISINKVYQALVEKLSELLPQPTTAPSTSATVVDDPDEFVLLRLDHGKPYFFPIQDVRRDSTEISLELLPESSEHSDFLRTLQDKFSDPFARYPIVTNSILACAYWDYADWVTLDNIVETSSHWELLLNLDIRQHIHNPLSEMTLSGFSADQIAEMRARRILLNEKLEDVNPVLGQRNSYDQQLLEGDIHGISKSSSELRLAVPISPIPQLYWQLGENLERFEKYARLVSILFLKLSSTVANVLQLDLKLFGTTQLQVKFKGIRPKFNADETPLTIEFNGICSLPE